MFRCSQRMKDIDAKIAEGLLAPIREALASGTSNFEQLCRKTKYAPFRLQQICRKYDFPLQDYVQIPSRLHRNHSRWDKVVALAMQGTLQEAADVIGITRERVRQIIIKTGKLAERRERRLASRVQRAWKKEEKREFLGMLRQQEKVRAKQEGWAWEQVVKYNHLRSRRSDQNLSHQKLVALFEAYERMKAQGQKISETVLAKQSNMSQPGVALILKTLGLLPTLRRITPEWKKKAIVDNYALMDPADLGYFLDVSRVVVYQTWKMWYQTLPSSYASELPRVSFGPRLFWRHASQVYEADDLRCFTDKDISELIERSLETVLYLRQRRRTIQPPIKAALQTLFPQETIHQPYLEDRVNLFAREAARYKPF